MTQVLLICRGVRACAAVITSKASGDVVGVDQRREVGGLGGRELGEFDGEPLPRLIRQATAQPRQPLDHRLVVERPRPPDAHEPTGHGVELDPCSYVGTDPLRSLLARIVDDEKVGEPIVERVERLTLEVRQPVEVPKHR